MMVPGPYSVYATGRIAVSAQRAINMLWLSNSRAAFQTRFTRTMSKEQRFLVHPTLPTRCEGKDIIVFPPTDTLVLAFIMLGAWVLPTSVDIDRYRVALSKALSVFPPVAGRLCKYPDTDNSKGDMYIKLTNSGVPVSVVDDHETEQFPIGPILVSDEEFEPWIDPIPVHNVINEDVPLLRVRFTNLRKTGQTIYTICWHHGLGDGFIGNLFTTYIAHFYRGADISKLPPPVHDKVFLPAPPSDPEIAEKFLPLMKHLRDAKPPEEFIPAALQSIERTSPVHITFSPAQIQTLMKRALAGLPEHTESSMAKLSRPDVLVAYMILHHNTILSEIDPDRQPIDTVVSVIDYRGNPGLAPVAMFGNAALHHTSPSFELPLLPPRAGPRNRELHFDRCLATIAMSIRAGTLQTRDREFLKTYLAFHNELCRMAYQRGLCQNLLPASDREVTFNSSHLIDWRRGGDFLQPGSPLAGTSYVRFHTNSIFERYIRIFQSNNRYVPGQGGVLGYWDTSLDGGLEAAFRIDTEVAEKLVSRIREDAKQGFARVYSKL